MKKNLFTTLAVFALAFVAVVVFGQDTLPLPVAENQAQAAIIAAFAALLPFAVAFTRKMIPGMPRLVVWAAAPALGALIGYVTGIGGLTGWKGLGAGLAAIALRELSSTFSEHKFS